MELWKHIFSSNVVFIHLVPLMISPLLLFLPPHPLHTHTPTGDAAFAAGGRGGTELGGRQSCLHSGHALEPSLRRAGC